LEDIFFILFDPMEEIIIKNFGPIRDLRLEIKRINILIGSTATGKSTVAKIVAIFNTLKFIQNTSYKNLLFFLSYYNINFPISDETFLEYKLNKFYWRFSGKVFESNFKLYATINFLNVVQESLESLTNSPAAIDNLILNRTFTRSLLPIYLISALDIDSIKNEIKSIGDSESKDKLLELIDKIKSNRNEINHGGFMDATAPSENLSEFLNLIKKEIGIYEPVYIPAERITMSMVAESIFGIIKNDVSLPQCLKDFGAKFEVARRELKELNISFFNATFYQRDNVNFVRLSSGEEVRLENTSSGFQSLIPMMIVLEFFSRKRTAFDNSLIIEEPELNLYPTIQKEFIELVINQINISADKLFITTHSPYILTTLDNLIQSKNAFLNNPNNKISIENIVDSSLWIDFNDISCYYLSDGTAKPTLDYDNRSIGASNIDDVSIDLGKTFDQLVELKYQ